jgi:putative DNA primase/helicase
LAHGPTAGGKTTTKEAFQIALGDYAIATTFETFLRRAHVGAVRNDIARIAGARMVTASEVDGGRQIDAELLKQLSGGDTISARFLYQEAFDFKSQAKIWLCANHVPKADDTDDALWRRLIKLPFEHTIPAAERDPNVKRILTDPQEGGPAVLAWMVEGCERWRQSGLIPPAAIEAATTALRDSLDPLRDFFTDECVFAPEAFVPVREMRRAYESYADAQGIRYKLGPKEFNRRLEARGCERKLKRFYNDVGTQKREKCWLHVGLENGLTYSSCHQNEVESDADLLF